MVVFCLRFGHNWTLGCSKIIIQVLSGTYCKNWVNGLVKKPPVQEGC